MPKKGTLAKLSIYKNTDNTFKTLESSLSAPKFAIEIDGENRLTTKKKLADYDTLVIALLSQRQNR
jgi:hypothetical protein